ncbi:unnamed protein product [Toxocara canis]|uniref:Haloacid dehalogenase n=1 Tax=Toxocara canis TaxID=6265 RepID=A0A183VE89_TOXCA|nr:unnamed protein product [Toxocara canis]
MERPMGAEPKLFSQQMHGWQALTVLVISLNEIANRLQIRGTFRDRLDCALRSAMTLFRRALRSFAAPFANLSRIHTKSDPCRFGLIIDADGVITRGREMLAGSREALQMITDVDGHFKIPTVFVTNASNTMEATEAVMLSRMLGIHVDPTQVIMAHSPLRLFTEYHEKPVLACGQGPVRDIAFRLISLLS